MAKGKKSFVLYADQRECFDSVPDEVAGKLIKHIFAYVNDENPVTEELLVNALFIGIKSSLKRDLKKWEGQLEQRREAGKKSAEIRKKKREEEKQRALTSVEFRSTKEHEETRKATDSVSVSDSVSDSVSEKEEYYYVIDEKLKLSTEDYKKLLETYSPSEVDAKIYEMENYDLKKRSKYKSMYLTLNKWLLKDRKEQEEKQAAKKEEPKKEYKYIRDHF